MRVDWCEYAQKCDDEIYFCRYFNGTCPHGYCEQPPPSPEREETTVSEVLNTMRPTPQAPAPAVRLIPFKERFLGEWPRILQMKKGGKTWAQIAKLYGITGATISKCRKENGLRGEV